MPDYKKQMKQAIYSDMLEEEQKVLFNNMMTLLGDKTPEQCIAGINKRIQDKENLYRNASAKYNQSKERIEKAYEDSVEEKLKECQQESYSLPRPAVSIQTFAESLITQEEVWNDTCGKDENVKGLSEVFENIEKEMQEKGVSFDETSIYKNLDLFQQHQLASYQNTVNIMKGYEAQSPEAAEGVRKNIAEYKIKVAELKRQRDESLSNVPTAEMDNIINDIKDLKNMKEDVQRFGNGLYSYMQDMTYSDIEPQSREKGLSLLTDARAEYRNNLNWFERILANILPSYLYDNAKYVDKINGYKAALSEVGFSEKEIADADPDKSDDYIYSKREGRYVKDIDFRREEQESRSVSEESIESSKSLDDSVSEYSAIEFDNDEPHFSNENIVPAKGKVNSLEDLRRDLADRTGDNVNNLEKSEAKSNNESQIQKGINK